MNFLLHILQVLFVLFIGQDYEINNTALSDIVKIRDKLQNAVSPHLRY